MDTKETVEVINKILIESLSKGRIPWSPEWISTGSANAITGYAYRGINAFVLPFIAQSRGWKESLWMTFDQARKAGGKVRGGEKGTKIYLWKFFKVIDKDTGKEDPRKVIPWLKTYTVFNVAQVDNVPDSKIKRIKVTSYEPVSNYENGPLILEDGQNPCYVPSTDTVHLPTFWKSEAGKYQTTFHELAHSTGHKTRLARDLDGSFGTKDYAREELVAEIASAYACAWTGKPWVASQTSAYVQSWLKALNNDPMMIIWASSRAEKAAKMILGISEEKEAIEEEEVAS